MDNNDDIDTDALQAQIDLSLSFTHNLVSSWIKPSSGLPKNTTTQNIEAEIKDILRKPSRLGVGASAPEVMSSGSREISRLKGQLLGRGMKRAREENEHLTDNKGEVNEDEDESRASAIKKKVKSDPFAAGGKKKKARFESTVVSAKVAGPSAPPQGVDILQMSSSARKRLRKKQRKEQLLLPLIHTIEMTTKNSVDTVTRSPESAPASENALTSSPKRSDFASSVMGLTKFSVLNLDGSPTGDAAMDPLNILSKKKRKKKKKRSDLAAAELGHGNSSHNELQSTSH